MSDEQGDSELEWMDQARMVFDQCWKKAKGWQVESETDKELREEVSKKISFWVNLSVEALTEANNCFRQNIEYKKVIDILSHNTYKY